MKWILLGIVTLLTFNMHATENSEPSTMQARTPQYLYKVLSMDNWDKSQQQEILALSPEDSTFIHFSTEDQLDHVISKFWGNVPAFMILKIEADKLHGRMVLEANPGGTNKYYHLYDGSVPMKAVVEARVMTH